MLSPTNVFGLKVSGTQSDATNDNREQDIIETHSHSLTGFQKRSCRTRGGLTSSSPRNEVELGLESILGRRWVLPELKPDAQYFSIGLGVSRNSHPVARDVASVTDRGQPMGPNQAPPATAATLMSA